jgi:hypothetical protein
MQEGPAGQPWRVKRFQQTGGLQPLDDVEKGGKVAQALETVEGEQHLP